MNKPKETIKPDNKISTLLELMEDGREYESLLRIKDANVNIKEEIQKSLSEIKAVRNREVICYSGNVVNQNLKGSRSIDSTDDLPFSEMVNAVPSGIREIDIILVTGGGFPNQVSKFVNKLRSRFEKVTFLIPNIAMSAGTIFAMSGDEIIMGPDSYLGPTDPQVPNKDGILVPAKSLLTLLEEIQKRGEEAFKKNIQPPWTDLQILKHMDLRDLASAKRSSELIAKMVEDYLFDYKFKAWIKHSDGKTLVTEEEKRNRAKKIADLLCDHTTWKVHDRGITRLDAWTLCELKITSVENVVGLERALRRFWALLYYIFETSTVHKIYGSNDYFVAKSGSAESN